MEPLCGHEHCERTPLELSPGNYAHFCAEHLHQFWKDNTPFTGGALSRAQADNARLREFAKFTRGLHCLRTEIRGIDYVPICPMAGSPDSWCMPCQSRAALASQQPQVVCPTCKGSYIDTQGTEEICGDCGGSGVVPQPEAEPSGPGEGEPILCEGSRLTVPDNEDHNTLCPRCGELVYLWGYGWNDGTGKVSDHLQKAPTP